MQPNPAVTRRLQHLDDLSVGRGFERFPRQGGAGGHGEVWIRPPAPVEEGVDLGLDGVEGLAWQGAPFDGQHTAVGDGRLLGAALNEGAVQVAGAEEGVRPPGQITVEVGERDEHGPGLENGVHAQMRAGTVRGDPGDGHLGPHEAAVGRADGELRRLPDDGRSCLLVSGHVASHGSAVRRQEQDGGVAGEHRASHCR
jgi:hypothetical protein